MNVPKMYAQKLKSARDHLFTFTGNGRYSVLKTSTSLHEPTTSPITSASKTSDTTPDTPTPGGAVAPIVTSSSGRVLRRPTLYKDTRR